MRRGQKSCQMIVVREARRLSKYQNAYSPLPQQTKVRCRAVLWCTNRRINKQTNRSLIGVVGDRLRCLLSTTSDVYLECFQFSTSVSQSQGSYDSSLYHIVLDTVLYWGGLGWIRSYLHIGSERKILHHRVIISLAI